jgi:hydroxyacylglutathione hydrolase
MNDTSNNMCAIVPLCAFNDNYIWLLRHHDQAVVVDPGDDAPVVEYLERHGLSLSAILVTHHHADHVGGMEGLLNRYSVPAFGPAGEQIAALTHQLHDGERIELPQLGVAFDIIGVPGHTRAHIAYYGRNAVDCAEQAKPNDNPFAGSLFCGDTLFACGCGRVFEGTPQQMRASLARLASLPGDTRIYPAHEYTQANTRFALAVEPQNAALWVWAEEVARLRSSGQPTLPTTLSHELAVNPFLRWDAPAVIETASRFRGRPLQQPDEIFAAIREWKNGF